MKVKLIDSLTDNVVHQPGEVLDLPDEQAQKLIEFGVASATDEEVTPTAGPLENSSQNLPVGDVSQPAPAPETPAQPAPTPEPQQIQVQTEQYQTQQPVSAPAPQAAPLGFPQPLNQPTPEQIQRDIASVEGPQIN